MYKTDEKKKIQTPGERPDPVQVGDSVISDFGFVFRGAGLSFINQFRYKDSLLLMGLGTGTVYVLNENEPGLQQNISNANTLGNNGEKLGDVLGLTLEIPILQLGLYAYARTSYNRDLLYFSLDVLATQLLASLETLLISNIPFHKRPVVESGEINENEQPFFNRVFRGQSSFPSGHMIGVSVMMFKGWQYYGYKVGLPFMAATVFIGWARIEAGEHYTSDVAGAVLLSGLASLVTTRTLYPNREHEPQIIPIISANHLGLVCSFQF